MKTFSRVAIAMVGTMGFATAASADNKAGDAKMADAKAAAMPEMKPPPEIAAMAKNGAGTWKCKGQAMDQTMKMAEMTGTMKLSVALNGWWIRGAFEAKAANQPFLLETFTTFDPASKKWKRVMVDSGGSWSSGESAGLKDGKVDWELATHGAMGEALFRDHEDMTDPKAPRMWGEVSMDKGKTFMKVYEMTCKK